MAIPGQGRIKRRLAAILAADVAGYSRPIIRLRIAPVDRRRQRVGAWRMRTGLGKRCLKFASVGHRGAITIFAGNSIAIFVACPLGRWANSSCLGFVNVLNEILL